MLVNSQRKRTTVVDIKDGEVLPEFQKAMDMEVNAFKTLRCVQEVQTHELVPHANLVSTRWVLTIKTKEGGSKRYKARLVARGFEDDERFKVTRASPTASSSSHRLVLQTLAER
jgi:hypothetical protein